MNGADRGPSGERHGSAWGAISFLNAIPTGVGAAAAISLTLEATVSFVEGASPSSAGARNERDPLPPLVRAVVETVREAHPHLPGGIPRVRLRSSIPSARGLKSSSALAVAIARAMLQGEPSPPRPEHLATLSADASLRSHQSVTGAFDDAMACARGGVVVAHVHHRKVLFVGDLPSHLAPVLWIPPETHPPAAKLRERWQEVPAELSEAIDLACRGDYLRAMGPNTRAVERALGYDYSALHRRGRDLGALASGVSGNGPAVAFVVPRNLQRALVQGLSGGEAHVLPAEFAAAVREGP